MSIWEHEHSARGNQIDMSTPARRPVASQLERIEQGLDALLQGQAALVCEEKERESLIARGFGAIADRLEKIEQNLNDIDSRTVNQWEVLHRYRPERRKPLKTKYHRRGRK